MKSSLLACCAFACGIPLVHAQVAGSLDPSFDLNVTATEVYATAVRPDGKLLLGGESGSLAGLSTEDIDFLLAPVG